jgi:metal-responsive CopG/Arc/MetJ family transcriptional regulator
MVAKKEAAMRRTQISLDEPLYEVLRAQAFERRVSMSQLIREALEEYLVVAPDAAATPPRPTGLDDDAAR